MAKSYLELVEKIDAYNARVDNFYDEYLPKLLITKGIPVVDGMVNGNYIIAAMSITADAKRELGLESEVTAIMRECAFYGVRFIKENDGKLAVY